MKEPAYQVIFLNSPKISKSRKFTQRQWVSHNNEQEFMELYKIAFLWTHDLTKRGHNFKKIHKICNNYPFNRRFLERI